MNPHEIMINLCVLMAAQESIMIEKGICTQAEYDAAVTRATADLDQMGAEVRDRLAKIRRRRAERKRKAG